MTVMRKRSLKSTGPTLADGVTCEPFRRLPPKIGDATLSAEDSHVKTSAMRESGRGSTESEVDCGQSLPVSFAFYDPDMCLWRTSRPCLLEEYSGFSGTWPRAGMMQNGNVYQRRSLVPLTCVIGCSLLPTPNAMSLISMWASAEYMILEPMRMDSHTYGTRKSGAKIGSNLSWTLAEWHLRNGHLRDNQLIPDPCFYEMMMGFPIGWTDLDASVMPSSPKLLDGLENES